MVNLPRISGELEHDIGMLKGEIRRVSAIFKDIKGRGLKLESDALNDKKSLDAAGNSLKQERLSYPLFKEGVQMRLNSLERALKSEMIEDEIFVKEIERAKSILEQIKRQFGFGENILHIANAEAAVTMAEIYIQARVQACQQFITKSLYPLDRNLGTLRPPEMARQANLAYDAVYSITKELNEATRQAMIQLLMAYKHLYQKYPLLIKILERAYVSPQRSRIRELA